MNKTEDVILLTSIDQRIRLDARQSRERLKLHYAQDLEKLRMHIHNDIMNMWGRCDEAGIGREVVADWLHLKTYDDTYHDFGPKAKQARTRERIEALLDLCHGDKELLLSEYKRELDKVFPLRSKHYEWAPVFIRRELRSGRTVVSLRYRWRRRKA